MIDEYLREFDRYLVGTVEERAEWRAELASHLQQADEAGDLAGALERLGSPHEAAVSFRGSRPLQPAPLSRRMRAAIIDHVLVVAVTAAIIVEGIVNNRHQLAISIPPPLGYNSSYPLFRNIAVPVVLVVTWLGLALIEGRHGRTPGKALAGIRAVADDCTPLTRRQAITRRAIILAGPLVYVDVIAMLVTENRQRLLDRWAHTLVVEDPEHPKPAAARTTRPATSY